MALDKSPAEELSIGSLSITSQVPDTTPSRPSPPELSRADKAVREYLLQYSTSFAAVNEIRERVSPAPNTILSSESHTDPPYQGWSSPEGDKVYQQKTRARDEHQQTRRTQILQHVRANRRHHAAPNRCLRHLLPRLLPPPRPQPMPRPGGLHQDTFRDMYPTIRISGITLAPSAGGHEVLVPGPRLSV